ncbi:MAG: hypothetical protein ABUL71_04860, partial [Gemmatimonadota bacterium]
MPKQRFRPTRTTALLFVAALVAAACVVSSDTVARRPSKASLVGVSVESPIKAHMLDGSVVVYPRGATISTTQVTGPGERFNARRLTASTPAGVIPLDSVVGFEVIERRVNPLRSL